MNVFFLGNGSQMLREIFQLGIVYTFAVVMENYTRECYCSQWAQSSGGFKNGICWILMVESTCENSVPRTTW